MQLNEQLAGCRCLWIDIASFVYQFCDMIMPQIFTSGGVPIVWDDQEIAEQVDPRTNSFITRENLDSVLVRLSL